MSKLKKIYRSKRGLTVIIITIIALVTLIVLVTKKNGNSGIEKITVKTDTISQEVEVTGKTKPSENVVIIPGS